MFPGEWEDLRLRYEAQVYEDSRFERCPFVFGDKCCGHRPLPGEGCNKKPSNCKRLGNWTRFGGSLKYTGGRTAQDCANKFDNLSTSFFDTPPNIMNSCNQQTEQVITTQRELRIIVQSSQYDERLKPVGCSQTTHALAVPMPPNLTDQYSPYGSRTARPSSFEVGGQIEAFLRGLGIDSPMQQERDVAQAEAEQAKSELAGARRDADMRVATFTGKVEGLTSARNSAIQREEAADRRACNWQEYAEALEAELRDRGIRQTKATKGLNPRNLDS